MWKHSEDCWAVWPQSSAVFISWILLTSHLEQMTRWDKLEKLDYFRTVTENEVFIYGIRAIMWESLLESPP